MINVKKYNILNIISKGCFGNVYKCKYNNKEFALKEEIIKSTLINEANIYKELKNVNNIAKMYDFFLFNDKYYLILDLYYCNLNDFKLNFYNNINYISDLKIILKTILITIQNLHLNGYVHRDLKPKNICLDKNNNPYIIDFGMAKKIIYKNNHIEERKIHNIIGTPNYISNNVINLIEPTRRDDLESIIYIYLYMLLNDELYKKYDDLELNNKKYIETIIDYFIKLNLYNNFNLNIDNISKIIKYIKLMKYTQTPNYIYIIDKIFT